MVYVYIKAYRDGIYSIYDPETDVYFKDTTTDMAIQVTTIAISTLLLLIYCYQTKKQGNPFGYTHFLLTIWTLVQIPSTITLSLFPKSKLAMHTANMDVYVILPIHLSI